MPTRWGATPEEWQHLIGLGLSDDLLPVVSNPEAKISAMSRMKALGKTPSRYNAEREVSGIGGWTQIEATPAMLKAWAAEPDYGICLQTRAVRAFDIDVDDRAKAKAITDTLFDILGYRMPMRIRANSGKRLIPIIARGAMSKRTVKVDGGMIELLATGQQFIAFGTHPSGARYEWTPGPHIGHETTVDELEAVFDLLAMTVGVAPPTKARGERQRGDDLNVDDPVAEYLVANWPTFGVVGGKLLVECPWKTGHSMDSGETESAWLLAGTEGHAEGHFRCLHASCQGRTNTDFEHAVGYTAAGFEVVVGGAVHDQRDAPRPASDPVADYEATARLPLPGFIRDNQGRIEPVLTNVRRALEHAEAVGQHIRYDTFKGEMTVSDDGKAWRPMTDGDLVRMRIVMEDIGFKPVGREMMRDAVTLLGEERQVDTAQEWLTGLPAWDGVPRIARFYETCFGSPPGEYAQAVGRYTWTALAGRVMEPGCKVDMVPILVGEQGTGKTEGVIAMLPTEEAYVEIGFHEKDDDQSRKMRGALIVGLSELRGLNGKDAEAIRAWVTRRVEKWIPKFREQRISFPRRCLLIGDSNPDQFLNDETGERRWLPLEAPLVDRARIVADRDEMWAEGLAAFRDHGVEWQEAMRLAPVEHAKFKVSDSWSELIGRWLNEDADLAGDLPKDRPHLTMGEVATQAIGLSLRDINRGTEMRIGRILRGLDYKSIIKRVDGATKPARVWVHVTTL